MRDIETSINVAKFNEIFGDIKPKEKPKSAELLSLTVEQAETLAMQKGGVDKSIYNVEVVA